MILEEILARRARRSLSAEKIAPEITEEILQAAILAPSCFNNQPWRIVAVADPEKLEKIKGALTEGNAWGKAAPLIFVFATKPSLDCRLDDGRDYALLDLGSASMCLTLQATRLGLIAHPIAGFSPKKVRQALGIPDDYLVPVLVIAGKPGDPSALDERTREKESAPRERKPIRETTRLDEWAW